MSETDTNAERTVDAVAKEIATAHDELSARIQLAASAATEMRLGDCERWLSDGRETIVRIRVLQTEVKLIEARERM